MSLSYWREDPSVPELMILPLRVKEPRQKVAALQMRRDVAGYRPISNVSILEGARVITILQYTGIQKGFFAAGTNHYQNHCNGDPRFHIIALIAQ